PRVAFTHLRNDLQPGDVITTPRMGQILEHFGRHGLGQTLVVTEQMLELWRDMSGDQDHTYKRILSGPMGVGKSYPSCFLSARAYAEGWLTLYIENEGVLTMWIEAIYSQGVLERFSALNKDILTATELRNLVDGYDGTVNISTHALGRVFKDLLKWTSRKTLLLVDDHWRLFHNELHLPKKFGTLDPLWRFDWWGEHNAGTRVIVSGTAHAKYEMAIVPESCGRESVVFVGPLSRIVFSKLMDVFPHLAEPAIRNEIIAITNCVPRELVKIAASFAKWRGPNSKDNILDWTKEQAESYYWDVECHSEGCTPDKKARLYTALLQTFLGSIISSADVDWDFMDLGFVYRSKDDIQGGTQNHLLSRPARMALLKLFKALPFPGATKRQLCDGSLSSEHFEMELYHHFVIATKPILLYATDLNDNNPTVISLDFSHCETLSTGKSSLGPGHEKVLTLGYKGYPRFQCMLGPMFFQVSVNDFASHNKDSADIREAFYDRDSAGMNQIERYLDDMFGPGHSAIIDNSNNKFSVTTNGVPVPGFRIV
ncbi:hypothetical protein BG004_001989, partial [Podila humilis]